MNAEFIKALDVLQSEKGIDKEELIENIESSIESAYRKQHDNAETVEVSIDRQSGEIKIYAIWAVVDVVTDPDKEISLEDAIEIEPDTKIGGIIKEEVKPKDFGRIAAQNAKQLIFQKIKESERAVIYNEYLERQDELIIGMINRVDRGNPRNNMRGNVYVDIGDSEGVMLPAEQIKTENYRPGKRIKVYLLAVKKTTKGPQITLSRTHPNFVKRLFEEEVPEIYDGVVDIINIAREAGSRTKIAIKANDPSVDPVGSCVGFKGSRVQNIINELNGEKIDVIKYSDDIKSYIANALSPAKVSEVLICDNEKKAYVVVDDFQFSLAIGKEGQNVRLAAKLTGWKIDIKSASDFDKMLAINPNFREECFSDSSTSDLIIGDFKQEMNKIIADDSLSHSEADKSEQKKTETDDDYPQAEIEDMPSALIN